MEVDGGVVEAERRECGDEAAKEGAIALGKGVVALEKGVVA